MKKKGNTLCYYRKFSDFYFFGIVRNASVLLGPYWVVWSILCSHMKDPLKALLHQFAKKKYYHVTEGCVALLVEIC